VHRPALHDSARIAIALEVGEARGPVARPRIRRSDDALGVELRAGADVVEDAREFALGAGYDLSIVDWPVPACRRRSSRRRAQVGVAADDAFSLRPSRPPMVRTSGAGRTPLGRRR